MKSPCTISSSVRLNGISRDVLAEAVEVDVQVRDLFAVPEGFDLDLDALVAMRCVRDIGLAVKIGGYQLGRINR